MHIPLQDWDDRDDDDIIVIERILLLIRNLLHITPEPQEEKVGPTGYIMISDLGIQDGTSITVAIKT